MHYETVVCWAWLVGLCWARSGDYLILRKRGSGPEIGPPGRFSAGFQSGILQDRPSERPKACRRTDAEAFPKSSNDFIFPLCYEIFSTFDPGVCSQRVFGSETVSSGLRTISCQPSTPPIPRQLNQSFLVSAAMLAMVVAGRKSGFRAGFWPDSIREGRVKSGRNRPGSTIA